METETAVSVHGETSHESLTGEIAELMSAERACFWTIGDKINAYLGHCPTKRDRSRAIGELATLCHCTRNTIAIRSETAAHFTGEGHRHPDVNVTLARACIQAGRRLKQPPTAVLEQALEEGWHVREVSALGQPKKRRLTLQTRCTACETKFSIVAKVKRDLKSLTLKCPVCQATKAALREEREVEILGVLS